MRRQVIQACVDQGRQCLRAQDKNALLLVKHAYKLISEDLVSFCIPLEYFCSVVNHRHVLCHDDAEISALLIICLHLCRCIMSLPRTDA